MNDLMQTAEKLVLHGIHAIALFPVIDKKYKSSNGEEAYKSDGLIQKTIAKLKSEFPLSIQSNGLTISDTIAASFSAQIVDDLVKANEVVLDVSVVNAFPISGGITVEFIDFNGQVIHEISDIGNIQSSLLGVMDTQENLMKMESSIEVLVGSEVLGDLNLINRIVLKAELNTETGVIQSIPSNAYLFFKSFLKVKTMNSTP